MKNKVYDLVIIGAGPAGLTAGLYAVRSGLKTAIISKDIGGTTNSIPLLENWPGFYGSGAELMKRFYEQLQKYEIDFIMDDVKSIGKTNKDFSIKISDKEIKSKTIILTTGTKRKKLNIKGEDELVGKGVSYCVVCDGFFFKSKIVAVVGGSDCAAISALALSDIAKKVYVVYRGKKLRCEDINSKKLEKRKNVEFIYEAIPKEIAGKEKVEGLKIEKTGEIINIKVDGIFVEIGAAPLTEFANKLKLKLNQEKYVVVDENMKTSADGVFAAGDITSHRLKQVVVASGQGAVAAKSAHEFLRKD